MPYQEQGDEAEARRRARSHYPVRKTSLREQGEEADLEGTPPPAESNQDAMCTRLDRTVVTKGKIKEAPNDFAYWQRQSYEQRLSTLEEIRHEYHAWKDETQPRLQRVCRIIKRA